MSRLVLLPAAALLAAAVLAAPGGAVQSPAPTGLLVLSCSGCPGGPESPALFTLSPRGGPLRRLPRTNGAAPAWSPDRRRVAYVRANRIHTSRADGSGARRLTAPPRGAQDDEPAWSSRGAIAFTRSVPAVGGRRSSLWRVPAAGGPARLLVRTAGRDIVSPAWSPDGRRIAYSEGRGEDLRLWVARADGAGRRLLVRGRASTPRWSPDGTRIAFWRGQRLSVLDLRSGRVRGYAWENSSDDVSTESIGAFAWAPDGRWLAYQSILEYECDELPAGDRCTRLRVVLLRLSDGAVRVVYRTSDPTALPEAHGLDWR